MALIEDITKGGLSTMLVGVGVAMVAPTVLPVVGSALRPLAKAVIRGGVMMYDAVKESAAEAGEQINDLVAEARAEMTELVEEATNGSEERPATRRRKRG